MALSAGSVVAGYTIEGVLGHGGMGTVYRARNPSLPRSDALKVLSAELSADPQFKARFAREAELAASLNHPNIVTVYARGESDGQLWIAMQYVAGSDADRELEAGRMTPARAVYVVEEVAKALDYAHRRRLLHRDVKPANFLLDHDDDRVFLADFGIARAVDEAVHLTQTGTVMASVAYAAPESLTGEGVDGRADIYSLGCSLYRLLTRQTPFSRSGGMAAVATAHLTTPPPRVTDLVPTLSRAFDEVIARAMAKNPADRFQTGRELAEAARRALDGTSAQAAHRPSAGSTAPWTATPPHGAPAHPGQPFGSGPTHAVSGSGSLPPAPYSGPTGPVGGTGAPFTGPHHTGQPFGGAPVPPPRRPWWRRRGVLAGAAVALVAVVVAAIVVLPRGNDEPGYASQTITHSHGSTEITTAPRSIAALGPGDAQAVMALGVQPVAVVAPGGALPSWEQSMVTGDTRVLPTLDTTAITAAKPDLIIDTGDVDDGTFDKLEAIAPTVTRPQSTIWTWQDQMTWIGQLLGRTDKADQLLAEMTDQQTDIRSRNPGFAGKTIQVVKVDDKGTRLALADSPAAEYLSGVGFRYSDTGTREAGDTADSREVADPAQLNTPAPDVRIVVRTDPGAGGGSYNGLPTPLWEYRGATVIVDDPAMIAAINDGGYAATEYLNSKLISLLARYVR